MENDWIPYVGALENRVTDLEAIKVDDRAVDTAIWQHPRFAEERENLTQILYTEIVKYAERLCLGLGEAFRNHFENGEFEISEEEFKTIIADAFYQ